MSEQHTPRMTATWSPPTPKKSSVGQAVGLAVGAIAGLIVVGCAALIACSAHAAPAAPFGGKPPTDAQGHSIIGLSSQVTYQNGVRVQLGGFERGRSSQSAHPASTGYVKFTVHVANGSGKPFPLTMLPVRCRYGSSPAHRGEQVVDARDGLRTPPTTALRPGYAITYTIGCVMPADAHLLEVEAAPGSLTGTALFAGNIT